jgi:DNA repair photolyase
VFLADKNISQRNKTQKISGTKEWAVVNVNCLKGCPHGCLYCYAKAMALRFHRVESDSDWLTPVPVEKGATRSCCKRYDGRVMFPSTHDITPEFLEPCLTVLGKLLTAGNDVTIVSKPHLECIQRICQDFADHKEQILFRFSIGSYNDSILSFWEPSAPNYAERLACLEYAFTNGFKTSVSTEPMLDAPNVVELFYRLAPYVTDSIWVGKMNRARNCIKDRTPEVEAAIQRVEANQKADKIRAIYQALKDEPLVRWKGSIKSVVGLEVADKAGMDT